MKLPKIKHGWKAVLFVITFGFLAILRLHEYDRVPEPNHAEELLYGWSGIYLIETGVPVSWSTLGYPKDKTVFDGIVGDKNNLYLPATLRKPWLDEPPLYSLMAGGVAHLYGDDRNMILPTSHTRIPSVIASLITMGLIFLTAYDFFGFNIAMLSMIFYGLSPILVFGSRLSVPENIIAMATMGCLYLAKRYLNKPRIIYPIIFGLTAAILGLMKPTGFFLAPLAIFLAVKQRRWKDGGIVLILALIGVAAFVYYGYYFDWELFKTIVREQGVRFAGWSGLTFILTSPAYDIFTIRDGWYLFALLSAIYYLLKKSKGQEIMLLKLFFVYWLLVGLLSGTEGDLLPWYRYPTFPFLAIFGALGLRRVYRNPNFFTAALTIGLLMSSRYLLMNAFRPTTPPNVFRVVFFLAMVPPLVYLAWKPNWAKRLTQIVIVLFVILGGYYNSKYIYSIFPLKCESIQCPFGPSTKLSEIRLPVIWRFFVLPDSTGMLNEKRPKF